MLGWNHRSIRWEWRVQTPGGAQGHVKTDMIDRRTTNHLTHARMHACVQLPPCTGVTAAQPTGPAGGHPFRTRHKHPHSERLRLNSWSAPSHFSHAPSVLRAHRRIQPRQQRTHARTCRADGARPRADHDQRAAHLPPPPLLRREQLSDRVRPRRRRRYEATVRLDSPRQPILQLPDVRPPHLL